LFVHRWGHWESLPEMIPGKRPIERVVFGLETFRQAVISLSSVVTAPMGLMFCPRVADPALR